MPDTIYMETDVLIICGGVAGIRAAIESSREGASVILANKGYLGQDGALVWMAGSGYQAALYPPDSVDQHAKDTIVAGRYLGYQDLVHTFLRLSPESVRDLAKWGVNYAKVGEKYQQIQMPGHTYGRSMVYVKHGEFFGGEYRKVLPYQVRLQKRVKLMNEIFMIDLLRDIKSGQLVVFKAKSTILATGGFAGCYKFTCANPTVTGDGHGMAYRAGARITDMEFIQFLPTVTIWPPNVYGDPYPYSLVFELHGIFYNRLGERFMERYYPVEKDFATRQAMSRALTREIKEGRGSLHGGVYFSFRHLPRNLIDAYLEQHWDHPYFVGLREAGVDIREDAIEVMPAPFYVCGGCVVNELCETNIPGLYAAGEVTGGIDGADRLSGNALPFCMAMGYTAGREAANRAKAIAMPDIDKVQVEVICKEASTPLMREDGVRPKELKREIRRLMSSCMAFDRRGEELEVGIKELETIRNEKLPRLWTLAKTKKFNLEWIETFEARNMLDVTEMAMRSALLRTESRGQHERADYPGENPLWLKHIIIGKTDNCMRLATEPVIFSYVQPPESPKAQ
jgi:succinate dehydrogenase/fumarate reductase flavoprotein subunit